MNIEIAFKSYQQIEATSLTENRGDLYASAARYARICADWRLADLTSRKEMDVQKTAAHNALIDAANTLCREMAKRGEDGSWRELLGDDRKEIGDFACYLHCLLGLAAR
jgi:hypothetical protein